MGIKKLDSVKNNMIREWKQSLAPFNVYKGKKRPNDHWFVNDLVLHLTLLPIIYFDFLFKVFPLTFYGTCLHQFGLVPIACYIACKFRMAVVNP